MKLALFLSLALSTGAFAKGICDRDEDVRNTILKNLGEKDCAAVTDSQLLEVTDMVIIYEFGNHKHDKTKLKRLTKADLSGLDNLKELVIQFSDLDNLAADTFSHLSKLETLDLSHNLITSLDVDLFQGLKSLKHLEFDSNPYEGGVFPLGLFRNLPGLVELDIDELGLTTLQPGIFAGLGNLKALDLSDNKLNTFEKGVFEGLNSMEALELIGNPLKGHDKKSLSFLPEGSVLYSW